MLWTRVSFCVALVHWSSCMEGCFEKELFCYSWLFGQSQLWMLTFWPNLWSFHSCSRHNYCIDVHHGRKGLRRHSRHNWLLVYFSLLVKTVDQVFWTFLFISTMDRLLAFDPGILDTMHSRWNSNLNSKEGTSMLFLKEQATMESHRITKSNTRKYTYNVSITRQNGKVHWKNPSLTYNWLLVNCWLLVKQLTRVWPNLSWS